MITIVAHMVCVPGTEAEILAATQWFIPATRAEPGCIDFHLHRQRDDPAHFVWYENFADQGAVDSHVASPHVGHWFALLERLGARNDYRLYERFEVGEPDPMSREG